MNSTFAISNEVLEEMQSTYNSAARFMQQYKSVVESMQKMADVAKPMQQASEMAREMMKPMQQASEQVQEMTKPMQQASEMGREMMKPLLDASESYRRVAKNAEEAFPLQEIVTDNIRNLMRVHQMRQIDLAHVLGLSKGSVAQKLTNRISWTLPDISKMAQYFEIAPSRLLVGPVGLEPTTGGLLPHSIISSLSAVGFKPSRNTRGLLCLCT